MYPYELIRSSRRTLGLEITPDLRVVVRAPLHCPMQEIEHFVDSHTAWLDRHMAAARQRQTGWEYATGDYAQTLV